MVSPSSSGGVAVWVTESGSVPARVWQGTSESGVPVICWVTRVAVARDADTTQFEAELTEHRAPSAEALAFPLRMIL